MIKQMFEYNNARQRGLNNCEWKLLSLDPELGWLPSSNTYLVKHAYFNISFNLLMAEFVCSKHWKGETITRKKE